MQPGSGMLLNSLKCHNLAPYIKVQRQQTWPRAKPLQSGTCLRPSSVTVGLVILGKLFHPSDGANTD